MWNPGNGTTAGQWTEPIYFFYWFKDGETINGNEYLQLNSLRIGVPGSSIFEELLYRETDDGKVYVLDSSEEILIYDFDLNVGDTLSLASKNEFFDVNEIDTIQLIDGLDRRVLKSEFQREIIEGIGRSYAPFYEVLGIVDAGYTPVCFYVDDLLTYDYGANSRGDFSCSDFGLTSIDEVIEQNRISLSLSDSKIFTPGLDAVGYNLVLYNAIGQELTRLDYSSGFFDLSKSNLPAGMYVGQLQKDAQVKHTQVLFLP